MIYKESQEQINFFKWCRNLMVLKKYPELELIYCQHNTQLLTMQQAGRWKSMGGRSGIPDVFLPVARLGAHGLFIELKSPDVKPKTDKSKGGLSDVQIDMFNKLQEQGYVVVIAYSCNEAINYIEKYLS